MRHCTGCTLIATSLQCVLLSPALQAIRIDEAVPESATSSMVDDSFFVLLKAGRRSMGTGKAPSVVAILNQINSLLATLYRNALAGKLSGAAARLVAAAPAEPGEAPGPGAAAAAVAFNNAEVSAAYVAKLRQQLEELANHIFYQANDRDRIKLVSREVVLGMAAAGAGPGAGRHLMVVLTRTADCWATLAGSCDIVCVACHL